MPDEQLERARRRYAEIEQERQEIQYELERRMKKTAIKARLMALTPEERNTMLAILRENRRR